MRKVLKLCLKCNNKCKLETETGAKLISCKQYLSKRSIVVQNMKSRVNMLPDSERSLYAKVVFENE
jgi:hypothetical protein